MSISTQFYAKMSLAPYVEKELNDAKTLFNKATAPDPTQVKALEMWIMGPIEGKDGIYVWGAIVGSSGSTEFKVASINRIKDTAHLMVKTTKGEWYYLNYGRSASSIARQMDMLLHGDYTNIVPLHADNWQDDD